MVQAGSAQALLKGLCDFMIEKDVTVDDTDALGCDETTVNTGAKGVLRLMELKLNKSIHWFICQLHANELPLRHLIQTFNVKTASPKGYSGIFGKKLDGCEKLGIL